MKTIKFFATYLPLIFLYKYFKKVWSLPHKHRLAGVIAIIVYNIHKDIKK